MPPTPGQNAALANKVSEHGEILARLTYIVEEDHKDLDELKRSVEIIAKAVAKQEDRAAIKMRLMQYVAPIVAAVSGVVAGHLIR